MTTHKSDSYTKLFSMLSGVRQMSCILSQLNIPCSSEVKLYYTKMTIHPLLTIHTCDFTVILRVLQRI